jgi:arabinofuranosyltransferase
MSDVKPTSIMILVALAGLLIVHAVLLSFTQDDAFISYRYVRNFIRGDGLVFNPGERVEGYTNFFFIILMAFFSGFGLSYMLVSKVIGIASGVAIALVSFIWLRKMAGRPKGDILPFAVPVLLAANSAFAYWCISGLETVLFAALVLWGVYLASRKNMLYLPVLAISALTRPEGGLVFILVLLYYLLARIYHLRTIAKMAVAFVLLIVPQFVFRLYYYGDILPNPFYAKTGWSAEYFQSGAAYVWLFLKQYGFYGLLVLVPVVFVRFLSRELRLALSVAVVYSLYILFIGGDVLHGHRFFITVMPLLYLSFFAAVGTAVGRFLGGSARVRHAITAVLIIALAAGTFFVPLEWIKTIRGVEIGLVDSMKLQANVIRRARTDRYTIALSTIGAFGYYSDAIVIDMLGLTDRTIAKNPEPVWGIKSTWKERNYNIPYVMKRNPDLVLFSTGLKPSAPAEKALFLSSKFRRGYYPVFHVEQYMWTIFKHKKDFAGSDQYFPDPRFINLYAEALNRNRDREFDLAYEYARQATEAAPPDFYLSVVLMGETQLERGNLDLGLDYLNRAVELSDGYALTAVEKLGRYYDMMGDSTSAQYYYDLIVKNNRLD